jgi:hypothetical protein
MTPEPANAASASASNAQEYSIEAIRYGTLPELPKSLLMPGAGATAERIDLALVFWLIRGAGHTGRQRGPHSSRARLGTV